MNVVIDDYVKHLMEILRLPREAAQRVAAYLAPKAPPQPPSTSHAVKNAVAKNVGVLAGKTRPDGAYVTQPQIQNNAQRQSGGGAQRQSNGNAQNAPAGAQQSQHQIGNRGRWSNDVPMDTYALRSFGNDQVIEPAFAPKKQIVGWRGDAQTGYYGPAATPPPPPPSATDGPFRNLPDWYYDWANVHRPDTGGGVDQRFPGNVVQMQNQSDGTIYPDSGADTARGDIGAYHPSIGPSAGVPPGVRYLPPGNYNGNVF